MSESAEKSEKPTQKRLEDARDKGQVPQSKQVSAIFVVATTVATAFLAWKPLSDAIVEMTVYLGDSLGQPWQQTLPELLDMTIEIATTIILPGLVLIGVAMIAGKLATSGVSFSVEPLKPKLRTFNAVANLKHIFGLSSLHDLMFMLGITALSGFVGWAVFVALQRDLALTVYCGLRCNAVIVFEVFFWVLAPLVVLLLAWAIFEVIIQRALHSRMLKMTKDEVKRENKDSYGDPHIKGERRTIGQEIAEGARLVDTTFVITGGGVALGFLYHPKNHPVPVLLFKFRGTGAETLLRVARRQKIPILARGGLAERLAAIQPVGQMARRAFFAKLARIVAPMKYEAEQAERGEDR